MGRGPSRRPSVASRGQPRTGGKESPSADGRVPRLGAWARAGRRPSVLAATCSQRQAVWRRVSLGCGGLGEGGTRTPLPALVCVRGGAWWRPRAQRLPRSCSLHLGPPCTLNQLFIKNVPIWCPPRRPPAALRALCSPSDKDFPAYQLNCFTRHPSGPLHPLHSAPPNSTFIGSLCPSEEWRGGGTAGAHGDIWNFLTMLQMAAFFCLQARSGAALSTKRKLNENLQTGRCHP